MTPALTGISNQRDRIKPARAEKSPTRDETRNIAPVLPATRRDETAGSRTREIQQKALAAVQRMLEIV